MRKMKTYYRNRFRRRLAIVKWHLATKSGFIHNHILGKRLSQEYMTAYSTFCKQGEQK